MKKAAFIFAILFPVLCYAEPVIKFEKELHDFGTVTEGILLEYAFEFINRGTEELVIKQSSPS